MNRKQKEDYFVIILAVSLFILGLLFATFCGTAKAEQMCTYSFNQEDAQKIFLNTERLQYCEQYATSLNTVISEQDEKINLLEQANDKLFKAVEAQEQAIEGLKKIIIVKDEQKELIEKKAAKDIKEAKRTGFIWGFGGGVITTFLTVLVGIILL